MLWSISRNKYTKYYSIVNLFKAVSCPIWWFFNFLLSTVGYLSSTCWCTKSFIHAPGQSKYCIMSETKKHCWDGWVVAQSWESHKELNKIKLHGRVQLLVQFESSGCLSKLIPYSRKLSKEKTFANWWTMQFLLRKFSRIARFCHAKGHHTPNFAEKNFVYSHKTAKFTKVFSLESFLLYDVLFLETYLQKQNTKRPTLLLPILCYAKLIRSLKHCSQNSNEPLQHTILTLTDNTNTCV